MTHDPTPKSRSHILRNTILASIAMAVLGVTFCPAIYRQFTLTRGLSPELVSAVTLKPNGDQPTVTLDDPDDIAAFID